ncbi:tripartite tricarboxylate transporter family receptor [Bordetella bronchiseptica E014]|uniref:Bug family tripartite tricarboxylate transporter substrate binding protein n=1 Tax=Bordetella bronchiseptica TaxID=518 RepID=UPI0002ED5AF4|nr:tripartite tricarboxylate transporter substrate binding protein [Bordetella bronchiseptica]KAK76439.1 tripartite tricarboxylate transporter family receptor [Bordetella bronchiseptica CA90 BB02]KDD00225.1 tripartite tricarboxylate transporter family receptor [Bordetella bronchiseptica MBORD675]KDD49215.1 tripartite tricarboxylate transporter family receptor [Bordetella bronchiseptica OSU553]AUL14722.1 hypothetical protein BTL45_07415 [Bordetella bronchiseptica]AWP57817.1 hypothetical protein
MKCRTFLKAVSILACPLILAGAARAESNYPSKPIRMIVPWVPGGFTDVFARKVAERMAQQLGQPVVVENKAGANGGIGTGFVARSPGDGYTIIMETADTHAINPAIYQNLEYDPVKDFKQISILASQPLVFAVNASVPARTVQEFVESAKTKPGQLSYGTWGTGSVAHLGFARFAKQAGIELNHIPYKGVSPALVDVVAGRVDAIFVGFLSAGDNFKTGKLRPLALTGAQHVGLLPDTQTMQELGYEDFDVSLWYGLGVPSSTPDAVVEKLSQAAQHAVMQTDIKPMLESYAMQPRGTSAQEATRFIAEEGRKWAAAAKDAGVELQ